MSKSLLSKGFYKEFDYEEDVYNTLIYELNLKPLDIDQVCCSHQFKDNTVLSKKEKIEFEIYNHLDMSDEKYINMSDEEWNDYISKEIKKYKIKRGKSKNKKVKSIK
jgi:hypothetical protein